jgi:alpha-tubulin suppressor-like RCC1 family protein
MSAKQNRKSNKKQIQMTEISQLYVFISNGTTELHLSDHAQSTLGLKRRQ